MYFVIANRISRRDHLVVSEPLAQELKFWLHHVDAFDGYAIKRKVSATAIVSSYASDTGFVGFTALVGSHVSTGLWSPLEACQSSTFRELEAILHILQSLSTLSSHHEVRFFQTTRTCAELSEQAVLNLISKPLKLAFFKLACLSTFSKNRSEGGWIKKEGCTKREKKNAKV